MPRLLICNESIASGGIGTYTLALAQVFKQKGWEVGFVVTHGPGIHYSDVISRVHHHRNLSPLSLRRKFMALLNEVEAFSPDILMLNHCSLAHYILPLISTNIKPVAVLHNDVPLFYQRAVLFSSRISQWVAPSERLQFAFRRYIPPRLHERVRTIPHGIDVDHFHPSTEKRTGRHILFAGNLGLNKGADLLPAIISGVSALIADLQVEIAGSGELQESLERECRDRSLPVNFLGSLPPNEMADVYRQADILLLPTRVEGFGLVITEAMSCATVPVVSRLDGITDRIVEHGVNGFLINPDNVEGFISHLRILLLDAERRCAMADAAVYDARAKFSLERMADDYERLFMEADTRRCKPVGPGLWALETLSELLTPEPDGMIPLVRRFNNVVHKLKGTPS